MRPIFASSPIFFFIFIFSQVQARLPMAIDCSAVTPSMEVEAKFCQDQFDANFRSCEQAAAFAVASFHQIQNKPRDVKIIDVKTILEDQIYEVRYAGDREEIVFTMTAYVSTSSRTCYGVGLRFGKE